MDRDGGLTVHLDLHGAALLSYVVARCAFVHAGTFLGQVLQSHDLRIFQVCFFVVVTHAHTHTHTKQRER